MAKTTNEVNLVWKVKGQNELASAIRGIGSAIKSIDFDKLSEVTGVASILSSLQSNKFNFDVTTGTGIANSIKQVNNLLDELNQVKELRDAINKQPQAIGYYKSVSQTAVGIPPEMNLKNLTAMQRKLTMEMNKTIDEEIKHTLAGLRSIIISAKETVKGGNLEGQFISPEIREQVNVVTNFSDLFRDALHKNFAKFKGIKGMIGESIDSIFRNMSQETRDKVIYATKQEIAKTKEQLRLAKIELSQSKEPGDILNNALNVQRISVKLNNLKQLQTQYSQAVKVLSKQEADARAAGGVMKNVQSAKAKADVTANADDLGKLFKDVLFINNKASAKAVSEAIEQREKDLIDFITKSPVYSMTPEEKIKFTGESVTKQQDIIRYRELLGRKQNVVSETEFQAMQAGKKIYEVPANFTPQYLDELKNRIKNYSFTSKNLEGLLTQLDALGKLTEKYPAKEKLFLTDEEAEQVAQYMLDFKSMSKKITSELGKSKTMAVGEATRKLAPEEYTKAVTAAKPAYAMMGEVERADALNNLLLKRKDLESQISAVKKQITGLNEADDKAHIEKLQKLSQELNLTKVNADSIKAVNKDIKAENKKAEAEERKARQEEAARIKQDKDEAKKKAAEDKLALKQDAEIKRQNDKEAKERERQQKAENRQRDKEERERQKQQTAEQIQAKKQLNEEEKIAKKDIDLEYDTQRKIVELDEQRQVYAGKRINLTAVLNKKEELLTNNAYLQRDIETRLNALGAQRAKYLQMHNDLLRYDRMLANAVTEEERQQIALEKQQYMQSQNEEMLQLHQLQMEKQQNDLTLTRCNLLIKTGAAHKENIMATIGHYLSLDKIVSRMSFVWTAMFSYQAMYAIQNGFMEAKNAAMTLNEQLQRMKSIMTDIEKQSIPAIKDSIIDLAKTYGLSMEELGSSMYEILSSNFNPEFATKILEGSTKMATAGLSSLQEAVSLMITSINAYGYSMDGITTLSDAFFEAVKVGRFTIGELGEDFATAATTAAIFGIDIREVLTALATMTNQGIKTNEAITALNRLMMNFASGGSAEAKKIAKELGIEMNSNAIKAKGLAGLVRDLNGATEEQIVALTGSVRAFKAMASVMTDPERYEKFYKEISNAAGATERALKEVEESQAFRLKKYKQEFTVGMMDIAELVMPLLIEGQKLLVSISKLFGGMGAKMALTTVAAGILAIAISKLIAKYNALSASIAGSNTQLAAASVAMKAASKIAAPVAIVAGIASIAAAIWQLASNAKKAKKEMDELNKSIYETVKEYETMYTAEEVEAKQKFETNIMHIREYVRIAKDETKTQERRKLALESVKKEMKALGELYPAEFEKLDLEQLKLENNLVYWDKYEIAIENTTKALQRHIDKLKAFAKVAGYQATISKAQEAVNDLDVEIKMLFSDFDKEYKKLQEYYKIQGFYQGSKTISGTDLYNKLQRYFELTTKLNISPFTYTPPPKPPTVGYSKEPKELYDLYQDVMPIIQYYQGGPYLDNKLYKAIKQLYDLEKQKADLEKKLLQATSLMETEGKRILEEESNAQLDYLMKQRPSIPTGGGEIAETGTTEKYDYRAALNIIEDAYLKSYETVSVGLDYDKIRELERAKEQELFDQAVEIINKIEKPTERDEAMLDFVKWLYDNRKERLTLILSNLKKKMDEASTAEVQSAIQKQMNDTINELLIAATQYQGFSLEEWKKKGATYKLPTTAGFQFGENKELQKILSEEDINIIKNFSMSPSTYKFYEKLVNDLKEQNKNYNLKKLIEDWIKAKNDNDIATQERISLEIMQIANNEKKFKLDLLQLSELLNSEAGLTAKELEELNTRIDLLGSGLWAAQLEYIVEAKTNVETTMERLDREYKSYNKKNIEIIKEWINSRLLSIEEIRKEANVLNTKFENLTIKEIDNLLLKPLPEDVKSVLDDRKNELGVSYKLLEQAHQEDLRILKTTQQKYYEDIDNLFEGKGTAKIFSIGVMKLLYMPAYEELSQREMTKKRNIQAREVRKQAVAGTIQLTKEQEEANEKEIAETDKQLRDNKIADLQNLISQMKAVWDEYYSYLNNKINDWYNNEVKKIDDRARQEHRSALWSEKQKEKLDKEREKKERKLMKFKKAITIAQIVYNTTVGIMKLWADFGFPAAVPLTAFLSALSVAQIAMVASQKYGKGGLVIGASHYNGGVPVELEGGEFIMSKKATAGNEAILYAIQAMLSSKQVPNMSDNIVVDKLTKLTDAVNNLELKAEFKGQVLNEVQLYKKTVKGQRLARVM